MIGVSEELTFRFSLQRLWARYGTTFFVVVSSLVFGLLHLLDDGVGVAEELVNCSVEEEKENAKVKEEKEKDKSQLNI